MPAASTLQRLAERTGLPLAQHLLYVWPGGLRAWRRSRRSWIATADLGPQDTAAFAGLLAAHPADRFRLLIDAPSEELYLEAAPPLRWRDLSDLLRRRLTQRFGAQPWAAGRRCGRGRLLLSGIRDARFLAPWVDVLEQARARVFAADTPALLTAALLARSDRRAASQPQLLVSAHPGGLRQTLCVDSVPVFTRLAALALPAPWARVREEVGRTLAFLRGARDLPGAGAVPQVRLIAAGIADFPAHRGTAPFPDSDAALLLLDGAVEQAATSGGGAPAFFEPSLRRGLRAGMARTALRRHALQAKLALVAHAAAAAAAVAALGVGLQAAVEIRRALERGRILQAQVQAMNAQLRGLSAGAADELPAGARAAVLEAEAAWRARHVDAAALLACVSAAFDPDRHLELIRLTWAPSDPWASAAAGDEQGGAAAEGSSAGRLVTVHTRAVSGSRSEANQAVRALAGRVAAGCGLRVHSLGLPYPDAAPGNGESVLRFGDFAPPQEPSA